MSRIILILLLISSLLAGQDYHWPIRASQSLSSTFSEYRSGHLHAGVDIKTWGEMEVPCLAIADGYVEHIAVNYNGYGRGLWLRLKDGNVAVYGHLEQFKPILEKLIKAEQLQRDEYSVHLKFKPDQYPVKAGSVIAYSGTSGTEHPHLHFEIRDTLGQVYNPQFFYSGIQDEKPPILDEIMLIPTGHDSRINGSLYPVIFDLQQDIKTVSTTGPFQVAINTHDRANGTYNKYNIYRAELQVNDKHVFEREFDQVAMRLTDDVDHVYPGVKGKRGWQFMSMYNVDLNQKTPFSPGSQSGIIDPAGLSELQIIVSDIYENTVSRKLLFHEEAAGKWNLKQDAENYLVTRTYSNNGYENFQFFTGNNSHIPISETLYRLTSTSWVFDVQGMSSGVRALGPAGSRIKWIIPPQNQVNPELDYIWKRKGEGFVLQVESSEPYIFPLAYALNTHEEQYTGELVQINPSTVESDIIPIHLGAQANKIEFISGSRVVISLPLDPMERIPSGESRTISLDLIAAELVAQNSGGSDLFVKFDTSSSVFSDQSVVGVNVSLIATSDSKFSGRLSFLNHQKDSSLAIFSPGKKDSWERHISPDSATQFEMEIQKGGTYFLLNDDAPPIINPMEAYQSCRRGERLVFKIVDNTGNIPDPGTGIRAKLDGSLFFPDYNPLRQELSFHVPQRLGVGQHLLEFSIRDSSGNTTEFKHQFFLKT